jgi:hypothetical protein
MDNNQTTELFARTLRRTEPYMTIEGPYRAESDVPVIAAIATILCVVAVFVWGWL